MGAIVLQKLLPFGLQNLVEQGAVEEPYAHGLTLPSLQNNFCCLQHGDSSRAALQHFGAALRGDFF